MKPALLLLPCCCASLWAAQPTTLIEWRFEKPGDLLGWGGPNHITELRAEAGALQGRIMDWDPFVRSPQFEVPATAWQRVEVRLKTDCGGEGQLFWTNTTESKYGGFFPEKVTTFPVIGDNQWHEYQIYPFWQTEGKIILLRLDLPRPATADNGKKSFAAEFVRIVDLGQPVVRKEPPVWDFVAGAPAWSAVDGAVVQAGKSGLEFTGGASSTGALQSEPLTFPADNGFWVAIEMAVDKGDTAMVRWVSSAHNSQNSQRLRLRPDGQFHTYNVDLSGSAYWAGDVLLLGLTPSGVPGAKATIRRIQVSDEPQGPAEVEVTSAGLENAINRAGPALPFLLTLINRGGKATGNLAVADLQLPAGVTVREQADWRRIPALESFEPLQHRLVLSASGPASGEFALRLTGDGAPGGVVRGRLDIGASLGLPKADYVPEPKPVETDYEIGALYFPGWSTADRWDPIQRTAPERKPVLGWYDEANPECADWQIKWAVENGIRFFMVDWYWSAGGRHLEHWVHSAYMKARYRRYLKWCMMWANHNPPNTHSEEDQRQVTKYWLDNYFGMPEYYRIDDQPVVIIWSVANMDRDLSGKGGAKRLLDISQEMVRAAGYKGIYFVAMKWPEAATEAKTILELKGQGFAMTSIYHYMHHGGKAENPANFPFSLVAESSYPFWRAWHDADPLPFLPNLSTGWDSRPWHGDKATVIYGRTVPLFRQICTDARKFAEETGIRRLALGPLNEWGEGSYLEPCREFGFEMYETVRDQFCRKPAGGWPVNLAPSDVGLGPYDLPEVQTGKVTAWEFSRDTRGWGALMGVSDLRAEGGELRFGTSSRDPAISVKLADVKAKAYPYVIIRMKIAPAAGDQEEMAQLFWSTTTAGVSEGASAKVALGRDDAFHDYVFKVGENKRWRGRITTFRFDPCSRSGAQVAIAGIRLSADGK